MDITGVDLPAYGHMVYVTLGGLITRFKNQAATMRHLMDRYTNNILEPPLKNMIFNHTWTDLEEADTSGW